MLHHWVGIFNIDSLGLYTVNKKENKIVPFFFNLNSQRKYSWVILVHAFFGVLNRSNSCFGTPKDKIDKITLDHDNVQYIVIIIFFFFVSLEKEIIIIIIIIIIKDSVPYTLKAFSFLMLYGSHGILWAQIKDRTLGGRVIFRLSELSILIHF